MDELTLRLRGWWTHKQGLDGSLMGKSAAEVLNQVGWMRCVGGVNPYLGLFARAGLSREAVDKAVAEVEIHELPAARGCTYVVGKDDFATALRAGKGAASGGDARTAERFFDFGAAELSRLSEKVLIALEEGPQDPKQLREVLGDNIRNFGQEGKNRGITTSLPIALGHLQEKGQIRRIPTNGRLDQERYRYALWTPSPMANDSRSEEEAKTDFARRYWQWIGPASRSHFKWFSSFSLKVIDEAIRPIGLIPIEPGSDLLILPEENDRFHAFKPDNAPKTRFVGSMDGIRHYHGTSQYITDPVDMARPSTEAGKNFGVLSDMYSNMIMDRGRIIGLWEFDTDTNAIVAQIWVDRTKEINHELEKTQQFVINDLGDAKTFSLDTPKSRQTRLGLLRAGGAV